MSDWPRIYPRGWSGDGADPETITVVSGTKSLQLSADGIIAQDAATGWAVGWEAIFGAFFVAASAGSPAVTANGFGGVGWGLSGNGSYMTDMPFLRTTPAQSGPTNVAAGTSQSCEDDFEIPEFATYDIDESGIFAIQ